MLLGHLGYCIVAVPRDEEAHLFEVMSDLFSGWSQGCCLCYNIYWYKKIAKYMLVV
jgi:hypothetical protein